MSTPFQLQTRIEFAVLAGGKSSRMGQDKGLMTLGNKPMIQYLLDTLQSFDLPIHIIANDPNYRSLAHPVYEDLYSNKGPMGGLYTALKHCTATYVLLLSCDTPFISAAAINKLIHHLRDDKIIVANVNDQLNPLFALYPVTLTDDIANYIGREKLKMRDFILDYPNEVVDMDAFVQMDPFEFYNINSPLDVIHCRSKWE